MTLSSTQLPSTTPVRASSQETSATKKTTITELSARTTKQSRPSKIRYDITVSGPGKRPVRIQVRVGDAVTWKTVSMLKTNAKHRVTLAFEPPWEASRWRVRALS